MTDALADIIVYAAALAGGLILFAIHLISMKRLKAADDRRAEERKAARAAAE
ncbi:MAG: hypothetical protein MRY64_01440 [Hyphomonadaceae bacterium]|nr:hypothetical protein [Hyphomonadaceae bacterium]